VTGGAPTPAIEWGRRTPCSSSQHLLAGVFKNHPAPCITCPCHPDRIHLALAASGCSGVLLTPWSHLCWWRPGQIGCLHTFFGVPGVPLDSTCPLYHHMPPGQVVGCVGVYGCRGLVEVGSLVGLVELCRTVQGAGVLVSDTAALTAAAFTAWCALLALLRRGRDWSPGEGVAAQYHRACRKLWGVCGCAMLRPAKSCPVLHHVQWM
jgi:hypothetical protein